MEKIERNCWTNFAFIIYTADGMEEGISQAFAALVIKWELKAGDREMK